MADNIGDFKKVDFQAIEKDLSKLERRLKRVDTSGVLGLGRKVVHQFNAGFEKLMRAFTGHGWISRQQAAVKDLDLKIKNLTYAYDELKIAFSAEKVSTKDYVKFNSEFVDQLNKMMKICLLARTKLGEKIAEEEVQVIEHDLKSLMDSCKNEIKEPEMTRNANKLNIEESQKNLRNSEASRKDEMQVKEEDYSIAELVSDLNTKSREAKELKNEKEKSDLAELDGLIESLDSQVSLEEEVLGKVESAKAALREIYSQLPDIKKDLPKDIIISLEENQKKLGNLIKQDWPTNSPDEMRLIFTQIKTWIGAIYMASETPIPDNLFKDLDQIKESLKTV